jgi:hypothetical protein
MASSSRCIGFSTGAVAKGDFRQALTLLRQAGLNAVELSALREDELPRLADALASLDLSGFAYVSVHVPSALNRLTESDVLKLVEPALRRGFPIVMHPDMIKTPELWRHLGRAVLIENMDKRKPTGRTTAELSESLSLLPDAGVCFDIAHARQVDPTMSEASQILRAFGPRIRQIHVSGVGTNSSHGRLSIAACFAISRISHLIPDILPIILESPVDESSLSSEINFALNAFSPWADRLRTDIDDVFDLRIPDLRRRQVINFLKELQLTGTNLGDFENVIRRLPTGGAYKPGDVLLSAADLLGMLSAQQKEELRDYFFQRISRVADEFPDLRAQFRDQFSNVCLAR